MRVIEVRALKYFDISVKHPLMVNNEDILLQLVGIAICTSTCCMQEGVSNPLPPHQEYLNHGWAPQKLHVGVEATDSTDMLPPLDR